MKTSHGYILLGLVGAIAAAVMFNAAFLRDTSLFIEQTNESNKVVGSDASGEVTLTIEHKELPPLLMINGIVGNTDPVKKIIQVKETLSPRTYDILISKDTVIVWRGKSKLGEALSSGRALFSDIKKNMSVVVVANSTNNELVATRIELGSEKQ